MKRGSILASGAASGPVWGRLRSPLGLAAVLHFLTDANTTLLIPLLPLIGADLGLSYAELGLLRSVHMVASAVLQAPAGLLAERGGERLWLLVGNGWMAGGVLMMALAPGFAALVALAALSGLGGNAQHPLGSALVARAAAARRNAAIGSLNLAGDVGKLVAPLFAALVLPWVGWRGALLLAGAFSLAGVAGLVMAGAGRAAPAHRAARGADGASAGAGPRPRLWRIVVVSGLDTMVRDAALTFLPFVLARQGLDPAAAGAALTALFLGGAAGRFLLGPLADHWGRRRTLLLSEIATAAALLALGRSDARLALPLAVLAGAALNGSSTPLYAAVAETAPAGAAARAYGLFFFLVLTMGESAPVLFGLLADRAGLEATWLALAGLALGCAALVGLVPPAPRLDMSRSSN